MNPDPDKSAPNCEPDDRRPPWLVECWPRLLRFVAETIELQPPTLRDALEAAIDSGEIQRLEWSIDTEQARVIFGFDGIPLGHVTFEALTRTPATATRH